MAELISRLDTLVSVEYSHFLVEDGTGEQDPMPATLPQGQFLRAGLNTVYVLSPIRDQTPRLTVEVWDGAPEIPPGDWELRNEGEATFTGGVLEVNSLIEGEDAEIVTVGPPGRYGVRGVASGVTELITHYSGNLPPERWPEGIAHYVLQFWPAPAAS